MTQDRQELIDALLGAYREGIFPMADPAGGSIEWYRPPVRGIIPLEPGGLRITRSLRQRVRGARFTVTTDRAFDRVIRACAEPRPDQEELGSWIDERIINAYLMLHEAGHAHSVEAWRPAPGATGDSGDGGLELVGGLYGVAIGGAFAGESMFSRPARGGTDASKVCLVHLVAHLRARGFTLLDTQFTTDHLRRLGGIEIPAHEYHRRLVEARDRAVEWLPFRPSPDDADD